MIDALKQDYNSIKVGRVTPAYLDHITVMAYGKKELIKNVGQITVRGAQQLVVTLHDGELVKATTRAIEDASLDVNPQIQGQSITLTFPKPTKETRTELSKKATQRAEQARISLRNLRRDVLDDLKSQKDGGSMSQDVFHQEQKLVQTVIDDLTKQIDQLLVAKEKDIQSA